MAPNGDVEIVQEEIDSIVAKLRDVGTCFRNATQALLDSRVALQSDATFQDDATYQAFQDRFVQFAGLIYRVNLPIVRNVVCGLFGLCDKCVVLTLQQYLDQAEIVLIELAKLREEVSLACQISLSMTAKAKRLETDLQIEIIKLNNEAKKEMLEADEHRKKSEKHEKMKKGLHTAAWVVGGVGVVALTGGLGGLAVLGSGAAAATAAAAGSTAVVVSAETIAVGVAGAGVAVGGGVGGLCGGLGIGEEKKSEKSDDLQKQAQERSDRAENLKEGLKHNLLGCGKKFISAMKEISCLLVNYEEMVKKWKQESDGMCQGDPLRQTQGGHYKMIQNYAKIMKGSCSEFSVMVETARSNMESLGPVRDAAVVEFFQASRPEIREQLLNMDTIPLLEAFQLQELTLDGVALTRADRPSNEIQISDGITVTRAARPSRTIQISEDGPHSEDDDRLIEGGRLLKTVISELFRGREVSKDFTCEALRLFGVYHSCLMEFARALAKGLRDYCHSFSSLGANDMHTMLTAPTTDLGLYKERLQLGCALFDNLAEELEGQGVKQDGWEEMFIEVLEITLDWLRGLSRHLEQIHSTWQELKGNPRERRRRQLVDCLQKTSLEIESCCTTYLSSFADNSTGTPTLAFEELAQTWVGGWLRRQPQETRVSVQSVATRRTFQHIFPRNIQ